MNDPMQPHPESESGPAIADAPESGAAAGTDDVLTQRKEQVIEAVTQVYDPEIPVNIYDLGLIYDIVVTPNGNVEVEMTLTSPACPVAGSLPGEVEMRIRDLDWVGDVDVELVWDPPWNPGMISDEAKEKLGIV